jgi:MFS transporter, DHA1 family, solute carrier family 18 (vesicular amine transporter), member 1/2
VILPRRVSFRAVRRIEVAVALSLFVESLLYLAVIPLLPTYVDKFGLSTAQAALVVAVLPLAVVTTSIPFGYLAGRVGNRRVVLGGNALQTVATLVFAFAPNVGTLVVARAFQGLGSAIAWGAGIAWLTANAPIERRGEYVGRAMGYVSAGSIAGPAVGALAGAVSIPAAFSLVAAAAVVAGVATALAPAGVPAPPDEGLRRSARAALAQPLVLAGFALATAASMFEAATTLLAPLRLGELGYGAVAIGTALVIGAAVALALAAPAGRLIDRSGAARIGVWGGASMVLVLLILALQPDAGVMFVLVASLGVAFLLVTTAIYPLATAGADRANIPHGVVNGLINLSWSGGLVLGQAVAGATAEAFGQTTAYVLAAIVGGALLVATRRLAARGWRSDPESANVHA